MAVCRSIRPTDRHCSPERQLPSGRQGLSAKVVGANQRGRVVEAFVEVVFAQGWQVASYQLPDDTLVLVGADHRPVRTP